MSTAPNPTIQIQGVTTSASGTSNAVMNVQGGNPNNPSTSQPSSIGGGGGGMNTGQQQGQQQQNTTPNYSIPGILHYLQYEWQRFELERQQWMVEKAELQARIALLQGERKGQENLKNDLVRRIKMLEYCLRQERAKYHKEKFGTELPGQTTNEGGEGGEEGMQLNHEEKLMMESLMALNNGGDGNMSSVQGQSNTSGVNWKQGRSLLRQYLQEIGYTDTIIDVRSNRVRSLLGLNNNLNHNNNNLNNSVNDVHDGGNLNEMNSSVIKGGKNAPSCGKSGRPSSGSHPSTGMISDTEASVLATFEFLNDQRSSANRSTANHGSTGSSGDDDDDDGDEDEMGTDGWREDLVDDMDGGRGGGLIDSETEEVLAEFDFLSTHPSNEGHEVASGGRGGKDPGWRPDIADIGELAELTVANESVDKLNGSTNITSGSGSLNPDFRKTWNPRYILKSHFDCIRCLRFHSVDPLLVTCSEDETIKLWNLSKTQVTTNKGKSVSVNAGGSGTTYDLEPVYTFRGHHSRVLTLVLHQNIIYSGSQCGELYSWTIPDNTANIDPYDPFDSSFSPTTLPGHSSAIWSLICLDPLPSPSSLSKSSPLLVSASADNTIKVWDTGKRECIKSITFSDSNKRPTCLARIDNITSSNNNSSSCTSSATPITSSATPITASSTPITASSTPITSSATPITASMIAVSFTDGSIDIYDLNSLESSSSSINNSPTPFISFKHHVNEPNGDGSNVNLSSPRINSIVVHPTMPILVSAHQDRQIKFWDLNTGKCLHAMVAHLDEVTSLACDPNGLYLLSGSHDCSVRLWNFDNRTCVQEITSHRKKFDEAIFDVTFHPTKPFFASAGADGLAKVFV